MSAIDTLRTALFGDPPQPGFKPSREGVLAAFRELNETVAAIIAEQGDPTEALAIIQEAVEATDAAAADATAKAALAGQYANANTNADIPGAPSGQRGALWWAGRAAAMANSDTDADIEGFIAGLRGAKYWSDQSRLAIGYMPTVTGKAPSELVTAISGDFTTVLATAPAGNVRMPVAAFGNPSAVPTRAKLNMSASGTGYIVTLEPVLNAAGTPTGSYTNKQRFAVTVAAGEQWLTLPGALPHKPGWIYYYRPRTGGNVLQVSNGGGEYAYTLATSTTNVETETLPGVVTNLGTSTAQIRPAIAVEYVTATKSLDDRLNDLANIRPTLGSIGDALGALTYADVQAGYGIPEGSLSYTSNRLYYCWEPLDGFWPLKSVRVKTNTAGRGAIVLGVPIDGTGTYPNVRALRVYPVDVIAGDQSIALPADAKYPNGIYPKGTLVGFYSGVAPADTSGGTACTIGVASVAPPQGQAIRMVTQPVEGVVNVTSYAGVGVQTPALAYVVNKAVSFANAGGSGGSTTIGTNKYPTTSPGNGLFSYRAKAFQARKATAGSVVNVLLFGSSTHAQPFQPQAIADKVVSHAGPYVAQGYMTGGSELHGCMGTSTGTWTPLANANGEILGFNGGARYALGSGNTLSWTNAIAGKFNIGYWDKQGSFRYRVDGGAWVNVTTTGADARAFVTSAEYATGPHTFEIETTSAAGVQMRILDVWASPNAAASGVVAHKAGLGGSNSQNWEALAANFGAYLTATRLGLPDLAVLSLGRNDRIGNAPPAQFGARVAVITDAVLAAAPNAGVILMPQPTAGATEDVASTVPAISYRDAMVTVANTRAQAEYASATDIFGTFDQSYALGNVQSDLIHLTAQGGACVAAAVDHGLLWT